MEMRGADADEFRPGPNDGVVIALNLVVEGMRRAPEILKLEANDDVSLPDHGARAVALVEQVAGRKIHAPTGVDYGALQELGQFDQAVDASLAAGATIGNEHRTGGVDQKLCDFPDRPRITNQR